MLHRDSNNSALNKLSQLSISTDTSWNKYWHPCHRSNTNRHELNKKSVSRENSHSGSAAYNEGPTCTWLWMLKTILGLIWATSSRKPTRAGNHSILLAPLQKAALHVGRNASSETLAHQTPRCPSPRPLLDKTLAQPENNTRATTTKPGCAEVCLVPHSGAFAKGHVSV